MNFRKTNIIWNSYLLRLIAHYYEEFSATAASFVQFTFSAISTIQLKNMSF